MYKTDNKLRVQISKAVRLLLIGGLLALPMYPLARVHAATDAQLYLGPTSQSVGTGSNVTFTINMAAGSNSVYAWQAYISYPTAYFSSASVATSSGSPFATPPQADSAGSGRISITRFATAASAYNGTVATITLQSNGTAGSGSITLDHICASSTESVNCSAVVDGTGANVLGSIANAGITLATPAVTASGSSGSSSAAGGTTATKKAASGRAASAATAAVAAAAATSTPATKKSEGAVVTIDDATGIYLTVTVLDQNGKPVKDAKVTVAGVTGYTNKDGRVSLQNVSADATQAIIGYKGQRKVLPLHLQSAANQSAKVTIQVKKTSAVVPISIGVTTLLIIGLITFLLIDHGRSLRSLLGRFSNRPPKDSASPALSADPDAHFSAPRPASAPQSLPAAPAAPVRRPDAAPKPAAAPPRPATIDFRPAQPPVQAAPKPASAPQSNQAATLARQRAMEPGTVVHPSQIGSAHFVK